MTAQDPVLHARIFGAQVPQPDRAVLGRGHEPAPVRGDLGQDDRALVPAQVHGRRVAAGEVPQLGVAARGDDGLVARGGQGHGSDRLTVARVEPVGEGVAAGGPEARS